MQCISMENYETEQHLDKLAEILTDYSKLLLWANRLGVTPSVARLQAMKVGEQT